MSISLGLCFITNVLIWKPPFVFSEVGQTVQGASKDLQLCGTDVLIHNNSLFPLKKTFILK